MKHVIRLGLVAAALIAAPLVAQGADLARVPAVYKVPPPAAWTGCYVGFNIGGGWAPSTITDGTLGVNLGSPTAAGVVGGGQFGCDYQMGQFVIGIQAMASAADIRGSATATGGLVTTNLNVPWVETLTGHIGFTVQPTTLLYFKGGGAWVRDNITTFTGGVVTGTGIVTPNGWTVGAGIEFLFFNNWSAFAEYNYAGFGNRTVTLLPPAGGAVPINFDHNVQTLLVGLNYRFGGVFSPY